MSRWLSWLGGVVVLAVLATVAGVRMQPPPVAGWKEFAVGPPSGDSLWIDRAADSRRRRCPDRASGVGASHSDDACRRSSEAALAFLDSGRRAGRRRRVAPPAAAAGTGGSFPPGDPRRDIDSRSPRHARRRPDGERGRGPVEHSRKPVVDETGLPGNYNLEFVWGEDRERSPVAVRSAEVDGVARRVRKRE